MKSLIIYWIAGCCIVGLVVGGLRGMCPEEPPATAGELVVAVAVWPLFFAELVMVPVAEPPRCGGFLN